MYDKNYNKINLGDVIYFSCGIWIYQSIVYNITDKCIFHRQISEGNGNGQNRCSNKIECERYVMVINENNK